MLAGIAHPLNQCIFDLSRILCSLGFIQIHGSEILTTEEAFDFLNIPIEHPSRALSDTFYLDKNLTLANHATSVLYAAITNKLKPPFKIFCISAVHRNDDEDATHTTTFFQLDILVADTNLTFANMKYLSMNLLHLFGFQDIDFVPAYFPFTEPSAELYVKDIEIMGCGLLVDFVKKKLGLNCPCLAGGIGINRIASQKYNISDIRNFYRADYRKYEI